MCRWLLLRKVFIWLCQVYPGDTGLSLVVSVKVGRKYAVYLPKRVVETLDIKEGDKLVLVVRGDSIVLRKAVDFFEASLRTPKRLKLTPEEAEEASLEFQEELLGG